MEATNFLLLNGFNKRDADHLMNLSSDTDLVNSIARQGAFDNVKDVRKFIKAVPVLKANPFDKSEHGEVIDNIYGVRRAIAQCLSDRASTMSEEDKGVLQLKIADSKRYSFAAWALWEKNKNKLYLPCNVVFAYIYRWKFDPKEFFKHIHKHPAMKNMVTTRDLHDCERTIESFLTNASCLGLRSEDSDKLDCVQNAAVRMVLTAPYSAIQGGAGVGKTTTVSHLVNQIASQANVVCLAFTHKAKGCIKEKLGNADIQVSTIHSFIMSNKNTALERLFLLIDESSMVDIELLADLAKLVKTQCAHSKYQVVFVGDEQQLPAIGRGEFFRQFVTSTLDSTSTNVAVLKKCYRTDNMDLFGGYQAIREGRVPDSTENFKVIYCDSDKSVNSRLGSIINATDPKELKQIQFIAWQNKDVFKINAWVQERLVKTGNVGPGNWRGFFKNDRVIYKGDNKDGLTNAMIGHVDEVGYENGVPKSINVKWENQSPNTTFAKDISKDLYLAYCITAHSSQGSEYGKVVVPCFDVDKMMKCQDRRWFYTAVTRAKQKVLVIATTNLQDFIQKDLTAIAPSDITFP